MAMDARTGPVALARWSLRLPGYYLLRIFARPNSRMEREYHQRRVVSSLSSTLHATPERIRGLLEEANRSPVLQRVTQSASRLPYVGIFRAGPQLYAIARVLRPRIAVETGVGVGYSTSFLLEALRANGLGKLTSVDLPDHDVSWRLPAGERPGFLVPAELTDRWELLLGDTRSVLPAALDRLQSIDFFFHDSEHSYDAMMFEYELAARHLAPGGVIVSDDAMWNTALLDFSARRHAKIGFVYHSGGSAPVALLRDLAHGTAATAWRP